MILIAALGTDRVIGSGDGMPWNVPDEYAHFLDLIAGQTVLMGRRSWEIFGKDLTSAHNIVISRSARAFPGAEVAGSLEAAIRRGRELGKILFCAGGAGIYAQALPHAAAMHLSHIKGVFAGDAYFPAFDDKDWVVERRIDHPGFEFVVYRRVASDLSYCRGCRDGPSRPGTGENNA